MVETYEPRLNVKDLMQNFESRRLHVSDSLPEKVDLALREKKEVLEKKLASIASKGMSLFKTVVPSAENARRQEKNNGSTLFCIPLHYEVIDSDIPLSIVVFKLSTEDSEGNVSENIGLHLFACSLDASSAHELINSVENKGCFHDIGRMQLAVTEDGMELFDRFIDPKYREQGVASLLLNAGEVSMQSHADDMQNLKFLSVETAQLDVLCWLYNRGYRPTTEGDQERLRRVCNGDSSLHLGENLYVFEESIAKEKRTWENYKQAFRICMHKPFKPNENSDAHCSEIQGGVRNLLEE